MMVIAPVSTTDIYTNTTQVEEMKLENQQVITGDLYTGKSLIPQWWGSKNRYFETAANVTA
jgi:hypothetical protein